MAPMAGQAQQLGLSGVLPGAEAGQWEGSPSRMLYLECHFLQEAFLDSYPCRANPSSGPSGRHWAEVPFDSGVCVVTVCFLDHWRVR